MKKLSLLLLLGLFSCGEKSPKIGEKSIYNTMLYFEPNNPFMEGDTVEVRDVKNGYVKYLRKYSWKEEIESESIEGFYEHTRKINEK